MTTTHEFNVAQRIEKYRKYVSDVVKWNTICSKEGTTKEEAFNIQLKVTLEECKETLLGILQNDDREIVDGIADVIVTAGYLAESFGYFDASIEYDEEYFYYCESKNKIDYLIPSIAWLINGIVEEQNNNRKDWFSPIIPSDVIVPYIIGYNIYGDYLDQYIEAVLKSNNSKFFSFGNYYQGGVEGIEKYLNKQVEYCTNKYGHEHKNIVAVKNTYDGHVYYHMRAENGVGKILKPSTFLEPEVFL